MSVLVVEDQLIVALDMAEILRGMGTVDVAVAATVAEGAAALDGARFSCALLDRTLGGESTEDLARALRDTGVPFAWVTGGEAPEDAMEPVLRKPFSEAELTAMVRTLVGGLGATRAAGSVEGPPVA